ncbi:MAG: CoA pyrophosphatase [Geopsychrobacter sp.]|nr:CoA pyrophosphatase [Geopsychrobacter sp.]
MPLRLTRLTPVMSAKFTSARIREILTLNPAPQQENPGKQAAVAMILIGAPQATELLFIRRAEYPGDPWSGDVAFPGGGIETQDTDSRATAERETLEELSLRLAPTSYLGPLGTFKGAYLPVSISAHIYQLNTRPALCLNSEVVNAFYVPLALLLDPTRNQSHNFIYRRKNHSHPTIDLDGYCDHFLWGISYRLLQKFFVRLGIDSLS